MSIISISGENSVIDINLEDLENNGVLCLTNEALNPARQVFLNLPFMNNNTQELCWRTKLQLEGPVCELIVLLKNSTHIFEGNFNNFENVLFSDHKILTKTNQHVILDQENHHADIKLIIDQFKSKSGYIFCSHLNLINGGIVEQFLGIRSSTFLSNVNFILGEKGYEQFVIKELEFSSPINNLSLEHVRVNGEFKLTNVNKLVMKECNILLDNEFDKIKQIENLGIRTQGLSTRCLVPDCDGILYNELPSKEKLWDKYYTGAPKQLQQLGVRYKVAKRA